MKRVWNVINKLIVSINVKNKLFLTSMVVLNIIIGALAWLTIGRLIFPEIVWLLFFMAYPAMLVGFFGGIVYLYNHDFQDNLQ